MKNVFVPFSLLPPPVLSWLAKYFLGAGASLRLVFPGLQLELERAELRIETQKYLAHCAAASSFFFVFFATLSAFVFGREGMLFLGVLIVFVFTLLVFFSQINYPRVIAQRRVRKLDKHLLPALRALMIHINAGIPLFEAMVIVSQQEFGEVSIELRKIVEQINVGVSQTEALEVVALKNPSTYFRRALWQVMTGMKEGAPIHKVMNSVLTQLTKEQIIQIEKYGSQLNPLAMFYMIGAVIVPALGMTMLLVLTSFLDLGETLVKLLFWGLLVFVFFFQLTFIGVVQSKRPSLLEG